MRQVSSQLAKQEFKALLVDPLFAARILRVAKFTITEAREAGMAVYKNDKGKIGYSKVLMPDLEELKADVSAGLRPWGSEYTSISLNPLVYEYDPSPIAVGEADALNYDNFKVRPDLALTLHSHPSLSVSSSLAEDLRPYPSPQDFLTFELWQKANPGLVESILAVNKKIGKMAVHFYRQSESRGGFQPTYLHALAEEARPNERLIKDYMRRGGLNFVDVTYALKPTELLDDPTIVADLLFA